MPRRRGRVVATRCRGVDGSTLSRILWGATPVVSGIARTAHTNQPTMHNVTIAIGEAPDYSASRRDLIVVLVREGPRRPHATLSDDDIVQQVAVVRRLLLRVGDGLGVGELDGDADGVAVDVGCAEVVSELP